MSLSVKRLRTSDLAGSGAYRPRWVTGVRLFDPRARRGYDAVRWHSD